MKKRVLVISILILGSLFGPAFAEEISVIPNQQMSIYFVNQEVRYERGNSQDLQDRRPLNLGFDYQWNRLSLFTEFSRFTELTGNFTSNFERKHQDVSTWLRFHFLKHKKFELKSSFFAGIGVGLYEEELKTNFMGQSRIDHASPQNFSGVVLGANLTAPIQNRFTISMTCEVRGATATNFDPNPIISGIVRFGVGRVF